MTIGHSPLRLIAWCLLALYPVGVGVCAAIKVLSPASRSTWPEIFYGPAITLISSFLLIVLVLWFTSRAPGTPDRRNLSDQT